MNINKTSQVFDPISNKFVNIKSSVGKKIKTFNKLCEKCPPNKIFNNTTKACVNTSGKYKNILAEEIDYCNKYNLAMKQVINSDKQILDNILNIKLPNKVKLKDYFNEINSDIKFSLASKLNIKDLKYKKYINYIPGLLFCIFQLISGNPEMSSFVINAIKNILNSASDGILKMYINIVTNYINSPFLIRLISSLSLKKFLIFISGLIVLISNLPRAAINKNSVSRYSELGLTGRDIPFTVKNVNTFTDFKKSIDITEIGKLSISNLNAYDPITKTVSLSKLGINTNEIANPSCKLLFSYDDNVQLPFVQIYIQREKPKSVYLFEKETRSSKIKELKTRLSALSSQLNTKQTEILSIRETHNKYMTSLELQNNINNLTEDMNTVRKGSPIYNKASHKIFSYKRKLDTIKKILDSKKYSPLNPIQLQSLQPKLTSIVNWKTSLSQLDKELDKVNHTNINIFYPDFLASLDSGENFISLTNQTTIHPDISSNSLNPIPIQNATNIIKNTDISSNFNKINSTFTTKVNDDIEIIKTKSKFDQLKEDEQKRKTKQLDFENFITDQFNQSMKLDEITDQEISNALKNIQKDL